MEFFRRLVSDTATTTKMYTQRICFRCRRNFLQNKRLYSDGTPARDYKAAVQALNSLQSNFSIVEAIRKMGPGWNKQAVPEMIGWIRRVGYEPSDFDALNLIHIAGTKGKGSTTSFISSILTCYIPTDRSIQAERLPSNVGLYTSPHLRFVRERIKINNVPIDEDLFARCFWDVWDRLEANPPLASELDFRGNGSKPVYFHYLTLMALHCYMQQNIGSAVIESGIGGEYDTTNILANPSVTGVTSLGIDHEALLGDTIESIAWHKSGIFKKDVPAFSVPQPQTAMTVLKQRAREKGTEVHFVPAYQALRDLELGLQGDFQKLNASLAIAICASHLTRLGFTDNLDPLNAAMALPEEFVKGLQNARLGGRCDFRQDSKNSKLGWYIDGGHTLESIEVAGRWYASSASHSDTEEPVRILIFNQQTRDASSLARRLYATLADALHEAHPFTHAIFCPNTTYTAAGFRPDLVSINTNKDDIGSLRVQHELAKTWELIDPDATVHVLQSIEEAVKCARELAAGRRVEVLATGSLHLVGGLIDVIESETEADLDELIA